MPQSRPRILLTHPTEARERWYGDKALAALRRIAEIVINPHERPLTPDEIVAMAAGAAIVISDRQTPGDARLFAALPDLVAFERVAVDIRNVDVAAASAAGVLVTQASRGFMAAVAEWIVGAMIAASRNTIGYAEAYRRGEVAPAATGRQLAGSTLGVIGYGAIGQNLCNSALGLGMRVLVCDPYRRVRPPLRQASLADLLERSDFVVPLAPANEETESLIGEAALAAMRPDAWLINASRGDLVDEAALERALDEGRIAGAALDVGRAPDQKPSPHLAGRPDVIATPHIGGLTPEAVEHQAMETARQAEAILRGDVPEGAVNAEAATRLAAYRDRLAG